MRIGARVRLLIVSSLFMKSISYFGRVFRPRTPRLRFGAPAGTGESRATASSNESRHAPCLAPHSSAREVRVIGTSFFRT